MARVEINLPEHFEFCTDIDVHVNYINRADHLGNDSLVSILNEARLRFLAETAKDYLERHDISWINADLAVIYKSEARYGDTLLAEVAAQDFSKYGCDFVYKLSSKSTGKIVALAKTAMLLYDYNKDGLVEADAEFSDLFKLS